MAVCLPHFAWACFSVLKQHKASQVVSCCLCPGQFDGPLTACCHGAGTALQTFLLEQGRMAPAVCHTQDLACLCRAGSLNVVTELSANMHPLRAARASEALLLNAALAGLAWPIWDCVYQSECLPKVSVDVEWAGKVPIWIQSEPWSKS